MAGFSVDVGSKHSDAGKREPVKGILCLLVLFTTGDVISWLNKSIGHLIAETTLR